MCKRIVGIISFMNAAGAQEALLRLMRQLRARGYETEVWFLYEQVPCYRDEAGVRVLLPKRKLSPFEYVTVSLQLFSRLRREKPDAVIGFLPLGNVLGLSAAAAAGIDLRIASQRSPGPTFGRAMRMLDRMLGTFGVYQAIVCVSQSVRDSFAGYPATYRSKMRVVNNGIEWCPATLGKADARASFGLPPDLPLFAATGRFNPQKNYSLMVRAVAATKGIRLAIAGDGLLRAEAEELARTLGAADRIHFLGNISHSRVCDLLRASDGFIQTSLYEGQSNSTLEAMHEGLPIICSDIVMQRETVCEDGAEPAALLVPLADFTAWIGALEQLRDDRAFADLLGRRAKALVEKRFTLQRMIDGFEQVLIDQETLHGTQGGQAAPDSTSALYDELRGASRLIDGARSDYTAGRTPQP